MSEPSPTGNQLAAHIEEAAAEVIAFARSCTAAQWAATVPGEEWPVAVVVDHVAEGNALTEGWIRRLSQGEAVTITAEEIDEENARHAARCGAITVDDAVRHVQDSTAALASTVRALSPEELQRTGAFGPAGGRPVTSADMAGIGVRHARGHLQHAHQAVAAIAGT
jgi:hypothetical protein